MKKPFFPKNPIKTRIFFSFLFLLSLSFFEKLVHSKEISPKELVQSFVDRSPSLSGDFFQKIISPQGEIISESQGSFSLMHPKFLRWAINSPSEQLLIGDGVKLFFWDKDLSQVIIKKFDQAVHATPTAILLGMPSWEHDFILSDKSPVRNDGTLRWLNIFPKKKDRGFEELNIAFRNGIPETMEIKDAFGRISQFEFKKIILNPSLKPELFIFSPPEGADILSE